jgi:hypothetical protein
MKQVKVFCPKCGWVPHPADQWMCRPGCGCVWNTFDTCGVCPQCGKNWEDTQCPACQNWSRHADWYHEFLPEEVRQAEAHTLAE